MAASVCGHVVFSFSILITIFHHFNAHVMVHERRKKEHAHNPASRTRYGVAKRSWMLRRDKTDVSAAPVLPLAANTEHATGPSPQNSRDREIAKQTQKGL
ncbi:MAG: hypothetical protein HZA50_04120 [Planctomycetes bacterium]|nr:hypothetical protein [Planctomycetota bacterium]